VVEEAEVLHGKVTLESYSGTLEKLRSQGDEDDIVNVEQWVCSVSAAVGDEQRGV
jgi:hypothetical protein